MLQPITKTPRFQDEIKKYQNSISEINEGPFKEEVSKLLSKLITEVKKLDDMHTEMVYTNQLPSMGTEFRDRIMQIRKQLDYKIKEYKS